MIEVNRVIHKNDRWEVHWKHKNSGLLYTDIIYDSYLCGKFGKNANSISEMDVLYDFSSAHSKEQEVQSLCTIFPIVWDNLIDCLDEIALLYRRKSQFAQIIDEMFPEKKGGK